MLTRRLLSLHVGWLCEGMEEGEGKDEQQLTASQTLWLYAILCRLDKPVHAGKTIYIYLLCRLGSVAAIRDDYTHSPDVSALLRELVRRVSQFRAGLWVRVTACYKIN